MLDSAKAFFLDALNALHIYEITDKIPHLELWLLGLAALLGFLSCFYGYRHRNLFFAVLCLVAGNLAGSWIYQQGWLDINFSVALALLIACLFVFTYRLSPAELTFGASMYFLLVRWEFPLASALTVSILFSIAALFLARWLLSIITAACGSFVLLTALNALSPEIISLLPKAQSAFDFLNAHFLIIGATLALLGFLCQAGLLGSDPLFRIHKRR